MIEITYGYWKHFLFIYLTHTSFDLALCRFVYQRGFSEDDQKRIEREIDAYRNRDGQSRNMEKESLDDLRFTMRGQYDILSNVSNYHWGPFLTCNDEISKMASISSKFEYYRAYSYTKGVTPRSIRNRLIYFSQDLTNDKNVNYVDNMLCYYYDGIRPTKLVPVVDVNNDDDDLFTGSNNAEVVGKAKPQRNVSKAKLGYDAHNMSIPVDEYHIFESQITHKRIYWRSHRSSGQNDIICVNDYNKVNGNALVNSFVVLERHIKSNSTTKHAIYMCSCKVYSLARSHSSFVVDHNNGCLHCIYFDKIVEPQLSLLFADAVHIPDNVIFNILRESLKSIDKPVIRLSTILDQIKIYSVLCLGTNNCALVHISNNYVICQNGGCHTNNMHKRTIQTLLEGYGTVCPHLDLMKDNPSWLDDVIVDAPQNKKPHDKVHIYFEFSSVFSDCACFAFYLIF